MASIKAQAAANKRKLAESIGDENSYVRDLVNDDLDAIDELTDEYAEVQRQISDLHKQIDDEDDTASRKVLRAEVRALATEIRALDVRMVDAYVEKAGGERFGVDVLTGVPVRVQTLLLKQAASIVNGEDPTTDGNATA